MEINGEQVNGTKTYAELGLSEAIMRAIEKKGYVQATPVQAGAIPYFMEWKDVIAKAPTGTGKTFAFGIPMVEHIDPECADVQGLVLAPTRELAVQIQEELRDLCEFKEGVRTVCLYGGAPIDRQINTLKKKPQIVVATPGRLMDHMKRRTVRLDKVQTGRDPHPGPAQAPQKPGHVFRHHQPGGHGHLLGVPAGPGGDHRPPGGGVQAGHHPVPH